ncbi:DUF2510 domain-containing protein [Nocardia tengchongensis]|uniref:DUF2510 domain-containing protein n=1 Tax=Nocardia tengchongensis TaxID=2055889 RepID=UPI0036BE5C71
MWILDWPYMLGTWLAVRLGADNPSAARSILGWWFEIPYLISIATFGIQILRARARRQNAMSFGMPAATVIPVSSESAAGAPPAWYADPRGIASWRWWDGRTWTEFTS